MTIIIGVSLLALSDSAWGTIVTGIVAIVLGYMQMRTKASADAAVAAATKAVTLGKGNESEIKEVKILTTAAVRQGNSAALIQLEMYEVLAKQLAEMPEATQRDRDLYERAQKAVEEHKATQIKVDEEAKQNRDDARIVSQETVAKAVQKAANDATKNMSTNPKTGD